VATATGEGGSEPYITVRIGAFAARVAADLAATHADGSIGRITHLDMASRCLRAARRALTPHDRVGRGHVAIRQAHLDAQRGQEARALERVAGASNTSWDPPTKTAIWPFSKLRNEGFEGSKLRNEGFEGIELLHIRHGPMQAATSLILRLTPLHQQTFARLGPTYEQLYESSI
jgi:hypothetical protein